jgi:hypothetical protein
MSLFVLNRFDNIEIKDIKYCLNNLEQNSLYFFFVVVLEDHRSNKLLSPMSRKTSATPSNQNTYLFYFQK